MREYPGRLISMLYRKNQVFWAQYLKDYDITSAEYPILIALNRCDGITQEEIASRQNLDKSAVTRIIKSLLEKGFIERKKDHQDLRCNRVYLTEKGHAAWEPIKAGMEEWNRMISNHLSVEEIQQVVRILSQMTDNIEDYLKQD